MHRPRSRPVATRLAAVVLAATATATAACAEDGGTTSAPSTTEDGGPTPSTDATIDGDGWRGALLDAHLDWLQLDDGTMVQDVSSFTPTEEDARRFEAALPDALPGATNPSGEGTPTDLDGYVRQYTGVEGGGARHLVVNGFCPDAADGIDWQEAWTEVNDGGVCFWQATMDLRSGEVIRLAFNGQA